MALKKNIRLLYIVLLLITSYLYGLSVQQQAKPSDNGRTTLSSQNQRKYVSIPPTFGKTHFIIGAPIIKCVAPKLKSKPITCQGLLCNDGHVSCALFTPDDDVQQALIDLVNQENESIDVAVFAFTNKIIADELCNAQQRGVQVRVIIDATGVHDRFCKIKQLQRNNIEVSAYKPIKKKHLIIDKMHNKFVIFKNNIQHKTLVWTGSFNFTKSAAQANQENVVIVDDKNITQKFIKQFERLQKRSKKVSIRGKASKIAFS